MHSPRPLWRWGRLGNQWLQYKQMGTWKTALAWQVFSGAIIPAIAG